MTGSCLFGFCLFWSNTMFITCSSLWNVLKQIPVKYHHFSFCLSQLIIKAPFPLLLRWIVIFYYSITCSHCYHSFMQFLIIQHFQFSISQYPNQWNMFMYRTIQSILNTHYSIFLSTTMVNINYAQAILVRVIHLETNILIIFDALHSIQFEQNETINSWCFHFLVMHLSSIVSQYLVSVLYRLVKEKWEIRQ